MQSNQSNLSSWLTSSALLLAVAVAPLQFGCATGEEQPTRDVQARTYDGETVFEGIFFGVGPVHPLVAEGMSTDAIPEAERERLEEQIEDAGVSMAQWEEYREAAKTSDDAQATRAALVDWIAEEDPTFFERFGSSMQSGDHFMVDAALDEAIDLLQRASTNLEERGEIDDFSVGVSGPDAACGFGPACVVAVVAVGWAAVGVTVIIVAATAFWSGDANGEGDALARDRMVDYLANALRPNA